MEVEDPVTEHGQALPKAFQVVEAEALATVAWQFNELPHGWNQTTEHNVLNK
jgi:hypothetical protein